MALTNDLVSQFAKLTVVKKSTSSESTVYGEIVTDGNGNQYVRIDGSDQLTPVSVTTDCDPGDRVMVMIKDHSATVTGNVTSPSAKSSKVDDLVDQITEFEIIVAGKVDVDELNAERARIDTLVSDNVTIKAKLTATEAEIDELTAENMVISDKLTAQSAVIDELDATYAKIGIVEATYAKIADLVATDILVRNLEGDFAKFESTTTDKLEAVDAVIKDLDVEKLDASFANFGSVDIDKAKVRELYVQSGLINDLFVEDATISGYLIGVKIKGDLIEGNTIIADKLLIKGDDGLYYALNMNGETVETEQTEYNSINGSIITAESITANKIKVSDLAAFRATIGGFKITDNAIHTVTKESVDSSVQGIYLDNDGQMALGDNDSYIRYYKTTDDTGAEVYKLEISAESLKFGDGSKTSAEDLKTLTEHVKIGEWEDESGNVRPCVELAEGDSEFKQRITNIKTEFLDGDIARTTIDSSGVTTENMTVEKSFNHSGFVWAKRANGNYGLSWKG